MQSSDIRQFLIKSDKTIKEGMRQLGEAGERILYVVDNDDKLIGSLTDGDMRRWVLAGGDLSSSIEKIYNKRPVFVKKDYSSDEVKHLMTKRNFLSIPVLNEEGNIQDILLWDVLFGNGARSPKGKIDLPVVIMAGGKGTRLDPFTKVLPKPLIPIGDKSIIEIIMEKFYQFGVKEFYLSVQHKSRMIKAYFEEVKPPYEISYIEEVEPLGTIGSLKLMESKIHDSVIVSNCDIIIDTDYCEIINFHKERNNDLTIVGSFRHLTIPYGICHIENGGELIDIQEKPEHDYLVNTGMYIINKSAFRFIPKNESFHATDLIKAIKKNKGKVGVFPLSEKSWIDIGQWEEYRKALERIKIT